MGKDDNIVFALLLWSYVVWIGIAMESYILLFPEIFNKISNNSTLVSICNPICSIIFASVAAFSFFKIGISIIPNEKK